MSEDLGWTRTEFILATTVGQFVIAFTAFSIGGLIDRRGARPPQITRLPRRVPLSRARGATPTSAAISLRVSCPSPSSRCILRRIATRNNFQMAVFL